MQPIHAAQEVHFDLTVAGSVFDFNFNFWPEFESSPQKADNFGFALVLLCHFFLNKLQNVSWYTSVFGPSIQ